MKVYLGADHRGFELKRGIKRWLKKKDYQVKDEGNLILDPKDDYPIFSEKVGRSVVSNTGSMGILICGSGVGATAAVNKIDGVVASIGISTDQVKAGRHDDNMNVLVLAADEISFEKAKKMVDSFLKSSYSKKKRYERRLKEIEEIEKRN